MPSLQNLNKLSVPGDLRYDMWRAQQRRKNRSPAPATGPNLVVNGSFATDSDWVKGAGWSISGGEASTTGVAGSLSQVIGSITPSTNYLVTVSVQESLFVNGLSVVVGGSKPVNITKSVPYVGIIRSGLSGTSIILSVDLDADFIGSIDNITVREVL